jgi:hypothetical protein
MQYRLVKKVVTDRHNAEDISYYTEGSAGGVKWEMIRGTLRVSLKAAKKYYLDLAYPPTVTTEVLDFNRGGK